MHLKSPWIFATILAASGFEEEGGFGFFLPSSTRGGFDIGAVTQQVTNTLSAHPSSHPIALCHTADNTSYPEP